MSDHDDLVRASFARQVGLFSGPDSPFVRRPAGTVEQLEPLDDGMLVLDLCCGAAHAAEVVAPRVRQVVGVDLTASLLELGAARLAAAGVDNVLLQEGNAQALPFVAGSFDLAYCFASLHHVGEPAAAMAEMARVVAPGGRIVVQDLIVPVPDAASGSTTCTAGSTRRTAAGSSKPNWSRSCPTTPSSPTPPPPSRASRSRSRTRSSPTSTAPRRRCGPSSTAVPSPDSSLATTTARLTVSFWTSTLHATLPELRDRLTAVSGISARLVSIPTVPVRRGTGSTDEQPRRHPCVTHC